MRKDEQRYIQGMWTLFSEAARAGCTLTEAALRLRSAQVAPLICLRLTSDRRSLGMLQLFFREGDREAFALALLLWRAALEKRT